jgi:plasmid stabilization system protein ParE
MRIIFLKSALKDLQWFLYYYESVFPQGRETAQKQYYSIKALLKENPYIGHLITEGKVREFSIPNIPFSFIYRIKENHIEVLRVWDERRNRTEVV